VATFSFSLTSPVIGSLTMPYEIPDEHLPGIFAALARIYGAVQDGPDVADMRPRSPRELLRCLTDSIMEAQLAVIRRTLEDIAAEQARASVAVPTAMPGDPVVVQP
jgi:hypothetical protein